MRRPTRFGIRPDFALGAALSRHACRARQFTEGMNCIAMPGESNAGVLHVYNQAVRLPRQSLSSLYVISQVGNFERALHLSNGRIQPVTAASKIVTVRTFHTGNRTSA